MGKFDSEIAKGGRILEVVESKVVWWQDTLVLSLEQLEVATGLPGEAETPVVKEDMVSWWQDTTVLSVFAG